MSYIAAPDIILRIALARRDDPVIAWIEEEAVRPYITATSMAQTRMLLGLSRAWSPEDSAVIKTRLESMSREIQGDSRTSVVLADFDMKTAEILSEIGLIEAAKTSLSDMDLVQAAFAIQHNMALAVSDESEAWEEFAAAIPAVWGRLALRIFPPMDDRMAG